MPLVRVTLDQITDFDPAPMVITLALGSDNKPLQLIPYSGWWGRPKGNNWLRPIIFKPDGWVDFGGDPEDRHEERYARMQIFDRKFELGESFYLEDFEENTVTRFIVKKIDQLDV